MVKPPPPQTATIAERVDYLRELSGLDRAALSKLCGLSQSHVGMLIRGDVENPHPDTSRALARTLGVSLDWLLDGVGKAPSKHRVRAAVEAARSSKAA